MLELEGRDHADARVEDVRGIEPASDPDLHDGRLCALAREPVERESGGDFEERRGTVDPTGAFEPVGHRFDPRDPLDDALGVDRLAHRDGSARGS